MTLHAPRAMAMSRFISGCACNRIDALVHVGAHGTLEWLPGKSVALSESCWPEALTTGLPVIYPFIVNDPGESAQAKRRIGAVHARASAATAGGQLDAGRIAAAGNSCWTSILRPMAWTRPRRVRLVAAVRAEAEAAGVEQDLGLTATMSAAESAHAHRPLCLRYQGEPVRRRSPCLRARRRRARRFADRARWAAGCGRPFRFARARPVRCAADRA